MKIFQFLLICFLLTALPSCILCDNEPESEAQLTCVAFRTTDSVTTDSVFFTEDEIIWYDSTTHQLKLKDSITLKDIQKVNRFKFYLGTDSLFTARFATDYMSCLIDDVVLHFNLFDGNLYIEDGYPAQMNDSLRNANKEKRSTSWRLFIGRLDRIDKIRIKKEREIR